MSDKVQTREDLDAALDAGLLTMLKDGVSILSKDGDVVTVDAPHQIWEIARKRLGDLGMTKEVQPGDAVSGLVAELNLNDPDRFRMAGVPVDMPPISDEPDALAI